MNSPTAHTARFIATAQVPAVVREKARKIFADTFGVILSGAGSEVAPALLDYARRQAGSRDAAILGTPLRSTASIAALVNGTFGHALDFDDGIVLAPVHPSSVVVSALLSAASGLSGRQMLDAYAVGVEVAVKLAAAIGIDHYHRGWHGTGTIGVFGAVAALSHARKLDPDVTQIAFGIATSMCSGVQRNFGTMTKPLHTGWAAHNGVIAVDLAQSGFSAATDALEAKSGFFQVYGTERSRPELLKGLGSPWAIDDPGMSLKRFACCYASHRPMVGLLTLRGELGLDAQNVDTVQCFLAPGSLRALIYPRPTTGLEGKFSLEYALAAGVLDGKYNLRSFSDDAVSRPAIQALLSKITVAEDPRCAAGDPHAETRGPSRRGFVEVHARTHDGRHAMQRIDPLPGSPDQPLSWNDIREKFMDCSSTTTLAPGRAQQAFDLLFDIESCDRIEKIINLLQP